MRPVNLIPAEERPGGRKPLRSGPLAYIVVGALAAAVIALTAVVVTENKISDRKDEVARLQQEQTSVQAKAQALATYTQFTTVREQRVATVTSLADSRFDWERVLDELSLLLPGDIQLTSLSGSASPEAGSSGGAGVGMRAQIAGPALELVGCAPSQAAVANFVEALKGIDGVTRVGMQGSSLGGEAGGNATSASGCGGGGGTTASFQMVAAFDAAPVPPSESAPAPAPAPEASTESTSSESSSSEESTSSESSESSESTSSEGAAD
jgi:Tfp pilus assembly protein PilN